MLDLQDECEKTESWVKKILGKDLWEIPCMKSSFFIGFTGGAFTGLGTFLYTSRGKLSFDVGFYAYIIVTFFSWVSCRYKYESKQLVNERVRNVILQRSTLKAEKPKENQDEKS